MAKWAQSLIRISTFEVETLQKRLAEVVTRRTHVEMRLATLEAEFELESARSNSDPMVAHQMPAYRAGYALRRDTALADLSRLEGEENGVRDELARAFEDLKKFEHVAEATRLRRAIAQQKAENAALDETALRLRRPA